jgi:hypothetical protein
MIRVTLWEEFISPFTLGALASLGLMAVLIPALLAVGLFVGTLRIIEVVKKFETTH